MAERQQRHQIQQQRQRQVEGETAPKRRLSGRRNRRPSDSGVQVGGA
jgi:hypothetical protein